MKKSPLLQLVLLIVFVAPAVILADDDGFVDLFDGKTLNNWDGDPKLWRVEDGVIVGKTAEGSPNSFLCTEEAYTNFELTFEVKDDPGLNSGVQIRSLSTPDYKNGRVHGPQVEIETSPGESGYIYSEGTGRGWITKEQPIKDAYKNGQWNRYFVRIEEMAAASMTDDQIEGVSKQLGAILHGDMGEWALPHDEDESPTELAADEDQNGNG